VILRFYLFRIFWIAHRKRLAARAHAIEWDALEFHSVQEQTLASHLLSAFCRSHRFQHFRRRASLGADACLFYASAYGLCEGWAFVRLYFG